MTNVPRGLLVDLDGTLFFEDRPICGAVEAVERLRVAGVRLRFVTNISATPTPLIAERLSGLGFRIAASEIFGPVQAAARLLAGPPRRKCLVLVDPAVRESLSAFEAPPDQVDTVVMGDMGARLTVGHLNQAFRCLRAGADLIALQKNPFWYGPEGPSIDCGAFVAALEFAAGRPALVVGKPAPALFEAALADLGLPRDQVVVVGDDPTTDILGAVQAGLRSLLVRTGKSAGGVAALAVPPTAVLDSFADLPAWLTE